MPDVTETGFGGAAHPRLIVCQKGSLEIDVSLTEGSKGLH